MGTKRQAITDVCYELMMQHHLRSKLDRNYHWDDHLVQSMEDCFKLSLTGKVYDHHILDGILLAIELLDINKAMGSDSAKKAYLVKAKRLVTKIYDDLFYYSKGLEDLRKPSSFYEHYLLNIERILAKDTHSFLSD